MKRFLLLLVGAGALATLTACAGQECDFNSECGSGYYCTRGQCHRDCAEDFDCPTGRYCSVIGQCITDTPGVDAGPPAGTDAGPPTGTDAGPPTGTDAGPPTGTDAGPPTGTDAGPPTGTDAGPATLGIYLDRCSGNEDCESNQCIDDVGGSRMCSRGCTLHTDCASEHLCIDGLCRPDDTGAPCTMADQCGLDLCAGVTGFTGACTRPCSNAAECPAGYACTQAGPIFICANIERPADPTCLELASGVGCTAPCRTAADCPTTLPGFSALAYSCTTAENLCAPGSAIVGPDPIGATCRMSGGSNLCRSGICITDAVLGDVCTQACTEAGGCGPGFGCVADPSDGTLFCQRAGSGALMTACSNDADCDSSLCIPPGFCTRLCTIDGLCPSRTTCTPTGLGVSMCMP